MDIMIYDDFKNLVPSRAVACNGSTSWCMQRFYYTALLLALSQTDDWLPLRYLNSPMYAA